MANSPAANVIVPSHQAPGQRTWPISKDGKRPMVWASPWHLLHDVIGTWKRRQLTRVQQQAQLALGQRMHAAGIDDGTIGRQLAAVDTALQQSGQDRAKATMLQAERVRLLRELAALALTDDAPLPGADAEYQKARAADAALAALSANDAG